MAKIADLDGYDPIAEGEQDERGVDLLGLRENLRLTVGERLLKAQKSANSLMWFRNALQSSRPRKAA